MAKSSRSSEVGFFHFSFLDILACTVGVLVFMIAVIIMHTLGMTAPAPLRTELSGLNLDVSKLNAELETLRAEAGRNQQAREAVENIEKLKRRLSQQKELEQSVAKFAAQLDSLKLDQERHEDELIRLRALVPSDFRISRHEIELGTPVQRVSDKRALYFECENERVNPFFGRYVRKYYVTKTVGENSIVIRRRPGETFEETKAESSDWQAEINRIEPQKEYVAFIVRPSGFEIYLKLRRILTKKGIDEAWEPLETGTINMVIEGVKSQHRFLLQ